MKIAAFDHDGVAALGLVFEDKIVPLAAISPDLPTDMVDLIACWPAVKPQIETASADLPGIALGSARLLAPIARPGKILAIGLNYADHIAESGLTTPEEQVWFCKHQTSIGAPFDPVERPLVSTQLDYEVELVAIIGKAGRHIDKAEAPDHVFGYCVGNDFSVRDWQLATPQWMLGKSFDGHGPFGPWITTADAIGDPHRLGIRCLVNGEQRQGSNTSNLVFSVWDQIEHLSKAMTLLPGDIIFTGTPAGVGVAMDPKRFLRPGDVVRAEIDELGAIEAVVIDER
jgi:2-keto-4-pentenoate hydratase/2-oxohepta-3-ene-1,7-dioic acid hydratase in catechol pathway